MLLSPSRTLAVLLLAGLIFVPRPICASDSTAPGKAMDTVHKEWNWLTPQDKDRLLHSIPPAPLPGSPIDQQDLQGVLSLQASRTPQDIAEAQNDKKFRLEIVAGMLGPTFTKQNYPVVFALLDHVNQNEYLLNSTLKKEYQRPRPFEGHSEVKALFSVDGFSYPSGHTSGAYTLAEIIAVLFPDQKSALLARAAAVGRSRIVAGVHYPSDVDQGKTLADALVAALLANPAFQKDLAAAQAEIAGKPKIP
jgi:acid phosphatase (class A)